MKNVYIKINAETLSALEKAGFDFEFVESEEEVELLEKTIIPSFDGDERVVECSDEKILEQVLNTIEMLKIPLFVEISNEEWDSKNSPLPLWYRTVVEQLAFIFDDSKSDEQFIFLNTFKEWFFGKLGYNGNTKNKKFDNTTSNNKLGKAIQVLNCGDALSCRYKADGSCRFCSDCYAWKDEVRFKDTARNRGFRALYFAKTPVTQLCEEIEKNGTKTVRIDECGEISDGFIQIPKLIAIIKKLPQFNFTVYTKSIELVKNSELVNLPNLNIRYSGEDSELNTYSAIHIDEALDVELRELCPCSFKFENWTCSKCKKCYKKGVKDLKEVIKDESVKLPVNASPSDFNGRKNNTLTLREYLTQKGWDGSIFWNEKKLAKNRQKEAEL